MNFGFVIDNRKCIGCHACTVACKAEHDVPIGVNRTWVKYIEKGTFPDTRRLFSVMRCNHCADAPCVEICPVTALFTRKDGIVDFDSRRCIGCKSCTQACPYDALYMEPATDTAAKCNYCSHRVDIGLEPACVNVCPEHAIISGDMDDPASEISRLLAREAVTVRKPEKGTRPKLFYIDGDKASLDPMEANPDSEYMWSSQSSGVGHFAGKERPLPVIPHHGANDAQQRGRRDLLRNLSDGSSPRRVYDAPSKGVLWGWEVGAYVWTKAIASGAFLAPVLTGYFVDIPFQMRQFGAWVALVFLALTGFLLIKDLGRPDRFLYVLLRPQWRSWLTRGAYIITGYGTVLTAWIVANYFALDSLLSYLEPLGVVFALFSAIYTAFLFAQAKGRDFWQSPVLGLHMVIHSLMAGLAVFLIGRMWLRSVNVGLWPVFVFLMSVMIVINLITLAIEVMTTHATDDAHATVKMIVRGRFSYQFWLGIVFVGNLVPVLLMITGQAGSAAFAAALVLIGMFIGERIWVKAPQMVPLS